MDKGGIVEIHLPDTVPGWTHFASELA